MTTDSLFIHNGRVDVQIALIMAVVTADYWVNLHRPTIGLRSAAEHSDRWATSTQPFAPQSGANRYEISGREPRSRGSRSAGLSRLGRGLHTHELSSAWIKCVNTASTLNSLKNEAEVVEMVHARVIRPGNLNAASATSDRIPKWFRGKLLGDLFRFLQHRLTFVDPYFEAEIGPRKFHHVVNLRYGRLFLTAEPLPHGRLHLCQTDVVFAVYQHQCFVHTDLLAMALTMAITGPKKRSAAQLFGMRLYGIVCAGHCTCS
jgi:hypothetical protein